MERKRYSWEHDSRKARAIETLEEVKAVIEKHGYKMKGFVKLQEPDGQCWKMYPDPPEQRTEE